MTTPVALSIAGSDPSGGAGIQADLKAFSAMEVYGAAALTLATVQNTQGVLDVALMEPDFVAAQVSAVLRDIDVHAVKIGALGSAGIVTAVAKALKGYSGAIVLDPVMIAKSGDPLLDAGAVTELRRRLLPMATLLTPNLPEAAWLTGGEVAKDTAGAEAQGEALIAAGAAAVLLKGGHGSGSGANDLLLRRGAEALSLPAPRIETRNTHGTGCTLSAAIAARLARGEDIETAARIAKTWLTGAIAAADSLGIGSGQGPVHHFHALWRGGG